MRVIAGEKRHLLLKTVDDMSIRPTTDKIKETLFNIIQFDIAGKKFLDLFAGSGAIGIEALSRGAVKATFIDNNDKAIKVIKENLQHTELAFKADVIRGDASLCIDNLSKNNEKYDIVYIDPPYGKKLYLEVLEKLINNNLLNDDALIILETNLKDDGDEIENLGYEIIRIKKYKSNKHIFMREK